MFIEKLQTNNRLGVYFVTKNVNGTVMIRAAPTSGTGSFLLLVLFWC